MGDHAYNYDSSDVDLSDDYLFQRETELVGPSSVVSWEEDHDHQLQGNDEPMQAIYDIDEESIESMIADKDSFNLLSTLYSNISYTYQEDGS